MTEIGAFAQFEKGACEAARTGVWTILFLSSSRMRSLLCLSFSRWTLCGKNRRSERKRREKDTRKFQMRTPPVFVEIATSPTCLRRHLCVSLNPACSCKEENSVSAGGSETRHMCVLSPVPSRGEDVLVLSLTNVDVHAVGASGSLILGTNGERKRPGVLARAAAATLDACAALAG